MRSLNRIYKYPTGLSLNTDDLIEFHASRILLLIKICGVRDRAKKTHRIDGLTKLAKLDFFIRYPEFFRRIVKYLKIDAKVSAHEGGIESRMIRYHYGPWDERYYQVLPYLEAKKLITIEKCGTAYNFFLTPQGEEIASIFIKDIDFKSLVDNIQDVNLLLSSYTGSKLKALIYEVFEEEVSGKNLNEIIK